MKEEVILVVDDSRQYADFVSKSILPSIGYNALTAYSGRAGLNLLRERHPQISVMLLDLQMPDLSGLELLRIANDEGINVPAIMVTAQGSEQVIMDAFKLGIRDYLRKPIDIDELLEAITRALSETRLKREKVLLSAQLQKQVSWLMALSDVGRSVTSTLNIDTVLRRIIEASVSLTHAQQGFIALLEPKSGQLFLRAVKNIEDTNVENVKFPVNDLLIKRALQTGQPVRVERASDESGVRVSTGLLVYSLIHVPIFYQKHPLGVISVNNQTQRRNFTEKDEIMLGSLADYAAIAIVNAHSFEKAQAEIEERKRAEIALRNVNSEFAQLIASLSSVLIVLSPDHHILHWNPSAKIVFGITREKAIGKHISELGILWDYGPISQSIEKCNQDGLPQYLDPIRFKRIDGSNGYLGINISPIYENDENLSGFILLCGDITERRELENQLSQSQKLKSIGLLAAGIAHEINTPIQYVSDNTNFIEKSMRDLAKVLNEFDRLLKNVRQGKVDPAMIDEIDLIIQQVDLEFLRHEIPSAIQQSLDGIRRVTEIVKAMREFSHPGVYEKVAMDVNKAIESTLTVARNEWKYVADIHTKLAPDLPELLCLPGEINQALLNIIVNAAQAIQDVVKEHPGQKGMIGITTQQVGDYIEVQIADTGKGIPENIRSHIFEPFFTTKEVGRGSGQGLAIAYNVIEIKHGGKLTFKTEVGKGTTFNIHLPINPPELSQKVAFAEPVEVNQYG